MARLLEGGQVGMNYGELKYRPTADPGFQGAGNSGGLRLAHVKILAKFS